MSMNLIPSTLSTGSALDAYRQQLDIVSQNIANAQTTRTEKGTPYQRQMVSFEAVLDGAHVPAPGFISRAIPMPETMVLCRCQTSISPRKWWT